jgi:hypothetical protein
MCVIRRLPWVQEQLSEVSEQWDPDRKPLGKIPARAIGVLYWVQRLFSTREYQAFSEED